MVSAQRSQAQKILEATAVFVSFTVKSASEPFDLLNLSLKHCLRTGQTYSFLASLDLGFFGRVCLKAGNIPLARNT